MTDLQYFSASALTVVLAVAGSAKLRSPVRFRDALRSYGVIPERAVPALVVAVPVIELSAAALQWVPPLQRGVSLGITIMFVAFTALLLRSLLKNEDADCGCFGTAAPEKVSWFSIARNAALLALALAAVVGAEASGEAPFPAILAGVGAGLAILLLDQALTLLSGAQPRPRSRE